MINIIDLDNTLVFTDTANNHAYISSFKKYNMNFTNLPKRITKEFLKKNLINNVHDIIVEKENNFINCIDMCILNVNLLHKIKNMKNILWTSASPKRVKQIIKYFNLENLFKDIVLSNKGNPVEDISKICIKFDCELSNVIVYEDNDEIIKKLKSNNIKCDFIK